MIVKSVICCLIYFLSLVILSFANNLCKDSNRLDSIVYIPNGQMWFFTSGGRYWYTKDSLFPPRDEGLPLPGGFKRGDAAVYLDTTSVCVGAGEMKVYLFEYIDGKGNMFMSYDLRVEGEQWSEEPMPYNKHLGISKAQVDWTKPIEAMLNYDNSKVIVIQKEKYSLVDLSALFRNCTDVTIEGKHYPQQSILPFLEAQGTIDAITHINNTLIYLFQGDSFWPLDIQSEKDGVFKGHKGKQLDILKDLFKFKDEDQCNHIYVADKPEESNTTVTSGPNGDNDTISTGQSNTSSAQITITSIESKAKSGSNNWLWIIIVIIIIIIIVIIILIICCCCRKSDKDKSKDKNNKMNSHSKASSITRVGEVSLTDRSNTKITSSKTGSKANANTVSKTGSKAGSASGSTPKAVIGVGGGTRTGDMSSMGTSPSTMSVRSKNQLTNN